MSSCMGRTYHVRTLSESQLPQAYPLVQALASEHSLNAWLSYAKGFVAKGINAGGVLSAQDDAGYIYGLFCYEVVPDLGGGRVLVVEPFVALDLVDRLGPITVLIEAMERLAREQDCVSIHLQIPQRGDMRAVVDFRPFRAAGYKLEGVRLCRRLAQEDPRNI